MPEGKEGLMPDDDDGLLATPKGRPGPDTNQEVFGPANTLNKNSHAETPTNDVAIGSAKEPAIKDEKLEEKKDEAGNGNPKYHVDDKPYSVFTHNEKSIIIVCAGLCAFFSPISGQIYFPSLHAIAANLQVSSSLVNLTITTYLMSTIRLQERRR
jgi:hypothetical protein